MSREVVMRPKSRISVQNFSYLGLAMTFDKDEEQGLRTLCPM